MEYTPPTQVDVQVETNTFRPDGRNRIETTASYLEGDTLTSISSTYFNNPDISITKFDIQFELSDSTSASAGASLVDGAIIPEFSISQVVLDSEDNSIKLTFDRGLNNRDPRAVQALIQSNTVGGHIRVGDVTNRTSIEFNSDNVEVYENYLRIPLDETGFLTIVNYTRAVSAPSNFYWDDNFFNATGIQVAVPIIRNDNLTVGIGVQPTLIYNGESGTIRPAITGGVGASYSPSEDVKIESRISAGYGVTALVRVSWVF